MKVTCFFAKDCDRKAPRKAGESFAKDKLCFCERSDDRKAPRKAGERYAKNNSFFGEEWPFCLERILIKAQMTQMFFLCAGQKGVLLAGCKLAYCCVDLPQKLKFNGI